MWVRWPSLATIAGAPVIYAMRGCLMGDSREAVAIEGITAPHGDPFNKPCHRAANEPAKPPMEATP